jgi:N-dimethylarginine dimethylaminohydrolase
MTSTWFCENDPVERVLYHDPAAGLLSPGIFDIENIREDGQALTRTLSQKGLEIKSQSLSQFLDVIELTELKELAHDFINVQVINDSKQTLVLNAQMMDDLKDRTIERLPDIKTVILNKVTYKCKMDPVANQLVATGYEVEPFQDLFGSGFIITPAGVILLDNGSHEMKLLEFIFSKLNYPIIFRPSEPLQISQADCIPAGQSLYFIGSGELTTEECIRDIIKQYSPRIEKPDKNNLFGTTRVALVRDIFDRDENRAHLTDVLALVDEKTMLMVDTIHGRDNLRRRLVNEYVFFDGQFKLSKMDVELSVYLESEGYNVVVVPERLFGGQSIINLADKGLILGSKLLHEEIGASHVKKQIFSMNSYFNFNAPLNQTFLILRKWSGQNHMTTAAAVSRAPIVKYWHQISDKMAKTQTSNTILIVAPIGFCSNLQTLQDNYFMKASAASFKDVEQMALLEFSAFHRTLRSEGVNVVLASNERFYNAPDSCFPNNWFSSHAPAETGGQSTLVLYPMKAEARRAERREHIVSLLLTMHEKFLSFTHYEHVPFGMYLEGTGALVIDRIRKVAYCALSQRANYKVAENWAHWYELYFP